MNIFEEIKFLIKFNRLIKTIDMKNWKTTLTAIAGILLLVGHTFLPGIITSEVVANTTILLSSLGFAAAKDHNVTGGTIDQ